MGSFKISVSLMAALMCVFFAGCKKAPNSTSGTEPITTENLPVELKLKWQLGKRYDEHMTMVRTNFVKMPGSDKPRPTRSSSVEDFTVTPVKDLPGGGTELEFEIVGEKITGLQGGMSFDSARDPQQDSGNPVAPALRKLIGSKFSCDLDAAGNAANVRGVKEFFAQLQTKDPQILGMVNEFAGEDMIKQHAMPGWGLPEKPVKSGDRWTASRELGVGMAGTLKMDANYTFRGWQQHNNRKCALLEFTGDYATKAGSNPDGPVKVTIEKGKMTGSTWFDPELKMVSDTVIDQDMHLKITTQGRDFDSEMKQRIDFATVNVADAGK